LPVSISESPKRRSFVNGIEKFNKVRQSQRPGEFNSLEWEIKSNSKKTLNESIKDITQASLEELMDLEKNKELLALTDYLTNTVIPMAGTLPEIRDVKEVQQEDIKYLYEFQTNVKLRSKVEILDLSKDIAKIMIESAEMNRYMLDILKMLRNSLPFQHLLQYHFILMMYFTQNKNRGTSLCCYPMIEIQNVENVKSDTKNGFSLLTYITSLLEESQKNFSFEKEIGEIKRMISLMKSAENNEFKIEKILQVLNDYQLLELVDDESSEEENLPNKDSFDKFVQHLLVKTEEMNELIKGTNEKCEQNFRNFCEYFSIKQQPGMTLFLQSLLDLFEQISIEQKSLNWRDFLQRNKDVILSGYSDPNVTTNVEIVLKDAFGNVQKKINVTIPTSEIERTLNISIIDKNGKKTNLGDEPIMSSDPLIDPQLIVKGGLFSLASSNPSVASLLGNPLFNQHLNAIQNCVEIGSKKSIVDLENQSSNKDLAICARKLFIAIAPNKTTEELESITKPLKLSKLQDTEFIVPLSSIRIPLMEDQLSRSVPASPRRSFLPVNTPLIKQDLDTPDVIERTSLEYVVPERRLSSTGVQSNNSKLVPKPVQKRHSGRQTFGGFFQGGFFGKGDKKESTIQDTDMILDEEMIDITFGISVKNKVVKTVGIALSGYGILSNYKGEVNSKLNVPDITHFNDPEKFPIPQSQICLDTQQIRVKLSRKIHFRHMIIHIRATDKLKLQADDIIHTSVYDTKSQEKIHQNEIVVYPGCTRWMSMYLYKNPDDSIWRLRDLNIALLGSKSSIEPILPLKDAYQPKNIVARILRAEDIMGAKNGLSDAYCQVYFQFSKQKFTKYKTKVIYKSINPEWNTPFVLPLHKDELNPNFIVEVWDYSHTKFLGQVKIPLQKIEVQRLIRCKLVRREGALYLNTDKDIKGHLYVYFDVDTMKDMCDNSETKLFGVELNEVMARKDETEDIPLGIEYLLDILKKEGPDVEGVFRVPGRSDEIAEIIDKLDYGEDSFYHKGMIHSVASSLKQYLREMPEPVMTFALYENFVKLNEVTDENALKEQLSTLIAKIPKNYQSMLKEILSLAKAIELKSSKNKMTAENLAIVLGVNLLRSAGDNPLKQVNDISKVQQLFTKMLHLYPEYLE
jgi:hypothetical protein